MRTGTFGAPVIQQGALSLLRWRSWSMAFHGVRCVAVLQNHPWRWAGARSEPCVPGLLDPHGGSGLWAWWWVPGALVGRGALVNKPPHSAP